jgi:hypothetical protein
MDAEVVAASGKENNLIAESRSLVVLDLLHGTNGYRVCSHGQYGRSEEVIGLRHLLPLQMQA